MQNFIGPAQFHMGFLKEILQSKLGPNIYIDVSQNITSSACEYVRMHADLRMMHDSLFGRDSRTAFASYILWVTL